MIDFLSGIFLSNNTEHTDTINAAFPAILSSDCTKVAKILPSLELTSHQATRRPIYLSGEKIQIPSRIYSPEPKQKLISTLTPIQFSIFCCLFTRHHNGFIRQKYAETLLSRNDPWIPPYILLLLGEYVVEISIMLQENIEKISTPAYIEFCKNDPDFIRLISKRIVSYWDCYYRNRYPDFRDYPALIVAKQFGI